MAIVPAAQLAAAKRAQSSQVTSNPIFNTVSKRIATTVPKAPTSQVSSNPIYASVPTSTGTIGPSTVASATQGASTGGGKTDFQSVLASALASLGLGQVADAVPANQYQGEIFEQPDYQSGLQLFNATSDAAGQARRAAFRQALVSSGVIPDVSKLPSILAPYADEFSDATTLDAIRNNQFSTQAQLQRGLGQATAALPYQLAARGMAESGEAVQRGTQLTQDYDLQSNNNLSSLLSSLLGTSSDYGTALTGARSQWDQTQRDIATRLAQTRGYSRPTTPTVDYDAITRAIGDMFDQNTPAPAPAPAPAAPYTLPRSVGQVITPPKAVVKKINQSPNALRRIAAPR